MKFKFRFKNKSIIIILFAIGLNAILVIQAFYLNQSYEIEKEVLKKELVDVFSGLEYDVFMKTYLSQIVDSTNVYFSLDETRPDSTLTFNGSVRTIGDLILKPEYDTSFLNLRKQQLEDFYKLINQSKIKGENLIERVTVTFSQMCAECPGQDYKNYPLDSLLKLQFTEYQNPEKSIYSVMVEKDKNIDYISYDTDKRRIKKGLFDKIQYGIYDKRNKKWDYLSKGTDSIKLRNNFLLDTNFAPAENRDVRLYAMLKNERTVLFGRILNSLLLSGLLLCMVMFIFFYFMREISKQKKLSLIKNDFINNMTHEFKTPISNILLGVDNIQTNKIINEPKLVRNFSKVIREESIRLNQLVESILETAQLEQGNIKIELEKIDINQLINEVVKSWKLPIEQRGGELSVNLMADNSIVLADKIHLINCISNLIDNANKYSPNSPNIRVVTKNTDELIIFSVIDKGLGIEKKEIKNVFKKFYRVPTQNLHDIKGFGIGLNYVKNIIEHLNGEISVKSEFGKGSVFTISLPLIKE